MENLLQYFQNFDMEVLIRIVVSIILGSIIGFEREITNKSAGLRTQILVCLGSCIFTILSIYGFSTAVTLYPLGDPSRVAAQIITGIGFIGAGTVLRQGLTVTGLTTASTLWIAAAIGMACGCGKLDIAITCTILAIAVLVVIRIIEFKLMPKNQKHMKKIKVSFLCKYENYNEVYNKLSETLPNIFEYNHKTIDEDADTIKINAKLYSNDKSPVIKTYNQLEEIKHLQSISVKEIFE